MAIGERIRFIRNLRGMTQKYLGIKAGLPEKTADIRMAQYEAGARTPKEELTKDLARVLDVSPAALSVPQFRDDVELMHMLFSLEDLCGLTVRKSEDGVILYIDPRKGRDAASLYDDIAVWAEKAEQLRSGNLSREAYDQWRYSYSSDDSTQRCAKVPSQEFSDAIVSGLEE